LEVWARALGRTRRSSPVQLTWPARLKSQSCNVRSNPATPSAADPNCPLKSDSMTFDWPCPPGMRVTRDILRAPSGKETLVHDRAWQERVCE
jgi:hypothetical protein